MIYYGTLEERSQYVTQSSLTKLGGKPGELQVEELPVSSLYSPCLEPQSGSGLTGAILQQWQDIKASGCLAKEARLEKPPAALAFMIAIIHGSNF